MTEVYSRKNGRRKLERAVISSSFKREKWGDNWSKKLGQERVLSI